MVFNGAWIDYLCDYQHDSDIFRLPGKMVNNQIDIEFYQWFMVRREMN